MSLEKVTDGAIINPTKKTTIVRNEIKTGFRNKEDNIFVIKSKF